MSILLKFIFISDALMEIFYRYDLNGNGYLSRDEFNEFQMRSSGEACDNEAWDVLKGKIKKKNI